MITALQILVLSAYLIVSTKKFGIQESISRTTYKWLGDERYWFTAMCWLLAGLNLAQGMEGWGVLTSAGLGFTGITVNWMDTKTGFWVHSISAFVTILAPFIGVWVMFGIWNPFGIFLMLAVATYYLLPKPVLIIEVQGFALILISYMLR